MILNPGDDCQFLVSYMPQATHKEIHDNNQIIDSNHLPKKCVILTRDGMGLNLAIDFKHSTLLLSVMVKHYLTSLFVIVIDSGIPNF